MKNRNTVWKFFKGLVKFFFKILLILIWMVLRLVEIILGHLTPFLKKLISNH